MCEAHEAELDFSIMGLDAMDVGVRVLLLLWLQVVWMLAQLLLYMVMLLCC